MAGLIKKEIEKYVLIIKNDERTCYIWLKIETPLQLDLIFLIKILTFMLVWVKINLLFNLSNDIVYFKDKGGVVASGEMNAFARLRYMTCNYLSWYISQ